MPRTTEKARETLASILENEMTNRTWEQDSEATEDDLDELRRAITHTIFWLLDGGINPQEEES